MCRDSPDAGQPVGDEGEGGHKEEEDGGAILGVPVYFPGHSHQAQESSGFQEADKGGCLQSGNNTISLHSSYD